jgi:hypothetical protein
MKFLVIKKLFREDQKELFAIFHKFSSFLNFHQNNPIGGFYAKNQMRLQFQGFQGPTMCAINFSHRKPLVGPRYTSRRKCRDGPRLTLYMSQKLSQANFLEVSRWILLICLACINFLTPEGVNRRARD